MDHGSLTSAVSALETEQTCQWDVAGGELRALEDLLRAMMAFEPADRPTADQLLRSEYMAKWALLAWERQERRKSTQMKSTRLSAPIDWKGPTDMHCPKALVTKVIIIIHLLQQFPLGPEVTFIHPVLH